MPQEEGVGKKILNTLFGAWGPGEGATFVQEPGIGMLPSSFQWGDWLKGSYDKIKRGDVAGGISQGIRALGQTAAPFALPAALYKAPLAAPLGMVGSSILSSETEQRLKDAGVGNGRAALAGDVAGMLVGVPGVKKVRVKRIDKEKPNYAWDKTGWSFHDEGKWGIDPRTHPAEGLKVKTIPNSGYYTTASKNDNFTGVEKAPSWEGNGFVYKENGFVLGRLLLDEKNRITDITVPPPFQKKGIGTALIKTAKAAGVDVSDLKGTVSVSDAGAALLRKVGIETGN